MPFEGPIPIIDPQPKAKPKIKKRRKKVYRGAAKVISDMLGLLGQHGEHWTKGIGRIGDSFCITGALREVTNFDQAMDAVVRRAIQRAIYEAHPRTRVVGIENWNDAKRRSFTEVKNVLIIARDTKV